MLLKFFEVEARFPETVKEMPAAAVEYVAQQVKAPAEACAAYDWQGKTGQRHRGGIRAAYGCRVMTEEDQERLAAGLCPVELSRDRLAAAVVARCRNDHVEPPAPGQVGRLVGKAVKDFEARFCRTTALAARGRPSPSTSAHASTIRDRKARACGVEDARSHCRSTCRS